MAFDKWGQTPTTGKLRSPVVHLPTACTCSCNTRNDSRSRDQRGQTSLCHCSSIGPGSTGGPNQQATAQAFVDSHCGHVGFSRNRVLSELEIAPVVNASTDRTTGQKRTDRQTTGRGRQPEQTPVHPCWMTVPCVTPKLLSASHPCSTEKHLPGPCS